MNDYNTLLQQAKSMFEDENDIIVAMSNASAMIYSELTDLNWAGFYRTIGDQLVLGPFQGKVACTRIKYGKGVCGTAAATKETQLVPDVHQFPGHIACDSASNSEIVVPMFNCDNEVFAVLDIDSPSLNRFTEDDRNNLEAFAKILEAVYNRQQ